jgi:bifunctional non-homologous end joining protein LigD
MQLSDYKDKRNFSKTPEPSGARSGKQKAPSKKRRRPLVFVVQKHRASQLHYDFRLEVRGVLKSWAIPKGPSMNPDDRRLAIQVEDHPYDYKNFEGSIPPGNYGAGQVIVWDAGTYVPAVRGDNPETVMMHGIHRGSLRFELRGTKLKGVWSLIRFRPPDQWLLTKVNDQYATRENITEDSASVLSARKLEG